MWFYPLTFSVIPQSTVSQIFRTIYPGFDNVRTESVVKEVTKRPFVVITQRHLIQISWKDRRNLLLVDHNLAENC